MSTCFYKQLRGLDGNMTCMKERALKTCYQGFDFIGRQSSEIWIIQKLGLANILEVENTLPGTVLSAPLWSLLTSNWWINSAFSFSSWVLANLEHNDYVLKQQKKRHCFTKYMGISYELCNVNYLELADNL